MTNGFRKSLLATTIFTGVSLVAAPAFAQDSTDQQAPGVTTGDAVQEEMAQEEGVSVGAIKTRVHRAKQEFRKVCEIITTTV